MFQPLYRQLLSVVPMVQRTYTVAWPSATATMSYSSLAPGVVLDDRTVGPDLGEVLAVVAHADGGVVVVRLLHVELAPELQGHAGQVEQSMAVVTRWVSARLLA